MIVLEINSCCFYSEIRTSKVFFSKLSGIPKKEEKFLTRNSENTEDFNKLQLKMYRPGSYVAFGPRRIKQFGATKMRRLTQLSTAVVIWVDLNNKIRLVQSHNVKRERLGVRRRI